MSAKVGVWVDAAIGVWVAALLLCLTWSLIVGEWDTATYAVAWIFGIVVVRGWRHWERRL